MLDLYIKKILLEQKRVIIPQIGAFIMKTQGNKELISFNSILKFDDKKLLKKVAAGEKTDEKKAQEQIKQLTDKIKATLNKGDKYHFEGIGSIYQDANSRLQFLPVQEGITPKSTGAAAASKGNTPADKKEETPPPPTTSTTPEAKEGTPPKETSASSQSQMPPKTLHEKMMEKKKAEQSTKTPQTNEKTTRTTAPTPPPTANKKTVSPSTPTTSGQKKNNKLFLWASLGILFVAVGVTAYLLLANSPEQENDLLLELQEEQQKDNTATAKNASPDEIDQTDSKQPTSKTDKEEASEEDKAIGTETINEEETSDDNHQSIQQNQASAGEKHFYVVAGCFQQQQNAENYLNKLQKEGYQAEEFGMVRGMHAISYSRHTTREEALQSLQTIRREREPNAWILQY